MGPLLAARSLLRKEIQAARDAEAAALETAATMEAVRSHQGRIAGFDAARGMVDGVITRLMEGLYEDDDDDD